MSSDIELDENLSFVTIKDLNELRQEHKQQCREMKEYYEGRCNESKEKLEELQNTIAILLRKVDVTDGELPHTNREIVGKGSSYCIDIPKDETQGNLGDANPCFTMQLDSMKGHTTCSNRQEVLNPIGNIYIRF